METVRLLRSQLRTKSRLRVIDADALPLQQVARASADGPATTAPPAPRRHASRRAVRQPIRRSPTRRSLEAYEPLFANAAYWKKIGEEFQQPLIVTGTVIFRPHQRSGIVQREREAYDQFGRRTVVPMRIYMERKGYILRPKLVFIDGRSGETVLYQESYREERLYNASQNVPGAVVLLRADGPAAAVLPEHAEHPEGPRLPRSC